AEDGIRDRNVTGVQTCALPIYEFIVFRDRILTGDGGELKLDETEMFAMMLYKSVHLSDFEAIRMGTSNVDALYERGRQVVTENKIGRASCRERVKIEVEGGA